MPLATAWTWFHCVKTFSGDRTLAQCREETHLQCKWHSKSVTRKQMKSTRSPGRCTALKPGGSTNKATLTVIAQSPGATLLRGHIWLCRMLPRLTHKWASLTSIYALVSISLKTARCSWGWDVEKCSCAWSWRSSSQRGWLEDAAPPGLLGWNRSSDLCVSLSCGLWFLEMKGSREEMEALML